MSVIYLSVCLYLCAVLHLPCLLTGVIYPHLLTSVLLASVSIELPMSFSLPDSCFFFLSLLYLLLPRSLPPPYPHCSVPGCPSSPLQGRSQGRPAPSIPPSDWRPAIKGPVAPLSARSSAPLCCSTVVHQGRQLTRACSSSTYTHTHTHAHTRALTRCCTH